MAGSEENELDTSPCEDEVVVKEGRKRRAEVQEEDVDGNRSRAKTLFRHIGSAAGAYFVHSFISLWIV